MEFSHLIPFKPNVDMKAGNYRYAIFGHLISLTGGFFAVVSGLMQIFNRPLPALVAFVVGIVIFLVEWGTISLPILKNARIRGIVWLFATLIASFGLHLIPIILLFVGGTSYLVYYLQ